MIPSIRILRKLEASKILPFLNFVAVSTSRTKFSICQLHCDAELQWVAIENAARWRESEL